MTKLVLLRHGQSQWNKENRFTGWVDVPLSAEGELEAKRAGELMRAEGLEFDVAFTSLLKRAIKTLWLSLEELDQTWLFVEKSWRLNERMYGALQGLNKAEVAAQHGPEQVKIWRRSYDVPPPPISPDHEYWPGRDRRYSKLSAEELPLAESLKDTVSRFLPYWETAIAPVIRRGERVLIAAHGNSLRALVKHLDGMSDAEVIELNIPTGIPLVYELDRELRPVSRRYLGDPGEAERRANAVAGELQKR